MREKPTTNAVPNPGSDEALRLGCLCPVLDNAHGRGYLGGVKDPDTGETMFVITVGCAVHSPAASKSGGGDA